MCLLWFLLDHVRFPSCITDQKNLFRFRKSQKAEASTVTSAEWGRLCVQPVKHLLVRADRDGKKAYWSHLLRQHRRPINRRTRFFSFLRARMIKQWGNQNKYPVSPSCAVRLLVRKGWFAGHTQRPSCFSISLQPGYTCSWLLLIGWWAPVACCSIMLSQHNQNQLCLVLVQRVKSKHNFKLRSVYF